MVYKDYELKSIKLYNMLGYYGDYKQDVDEDTDETMVTIPDIIIKCIKPYKCKDVIIGVGTRVAIGGPVESMNDNDDFCVYLNSPYIQEDTVTISKKDILEYFVYDKESTEKFFELDIINDTLDSLEEEKQSIIIRKRSLTFIWFLTIMLAIMFAIFIALYIILCFIKDGIFTMECLMPLTIGFIGMLPAVFFSWRRNIFLNNLSKCTKNYETLDNYVKEATHELFLNNDTDIRHLNVSFVEYG